jgi:hypothetical protein
VAYDPKQSANAVVQTTYQAYREGIGRALAEAPLEGLSALVAELERGERDFKRYVIDPHQVDKTFLEKFGAVGKKGFEKFQMDRAVTLARLALSRSRDLFFTWDEFYPHTGQHYFQLSQYDAQIGVKTKGGYVIITPYWNGRVETRQFGIVERYPPKNRVSFEVKVEELANGLPERVEKKLLRAVASISWSVRHEEIHEHHRYVVDYPGSFNAFLTLVNG